MHDTHAALLVAVMALVTVLLRFLPFIIFNGKREVPGYIMYLGKVLPYAIMGMLIVYCLRNVRFSAAADWLPSAVGVAVVVLLHLLKRNSLLSILGGTIVYMALVQFVFV